MVCISLGRMVGSNIKDWENYKPNWYKASLNIKSEKEFADLMIWMEGNLQGHRKHTVWRLTGEMTFEIRFRYQKDYEWFVLRWS